MWDTMIRNALKKPDCVGGAFEFEIEDSEGTLFKTGRILIEFLTNLRAKYLKLPYGDQCIFVRRETFEMMGGFPQLDFMEDFEFVRQLNKKGYIQIINATAVTSGRRWKKLGLIKTTILNQCIIWAYLVGISPTKLLTWYYG
jgi:hypothetical protein